MKKSNIFIIIALLLVAVIVAALIVLKPAGAKTALKTPNPTEQPMPDSVTVILDDGSELTASMGVEEADESWKKDVEFQTGKSGAGQTPTNTPTPSASPSPSPAPTDALKDPATCSYEVFLALSPAQKDAFIESFESYEAFFEWMSAAQAEYAALHPEIEIGPGSTIDLRKLK